MSNLSKSASSSIESITGLPAPLVDLLAMCGHGNHAASWMTVSQPPHAIGVTGSRPFQAVLTQMAGTSLASIRQIPDILVVKKLAFAASEVHGFVEFISADPPRKIETAEPTVKNNVGAYWLEQPPNNFLFRNLESLMHAKSRMFELINEAPDPFAGGKAEINLVWALPYLSARDLLLRTLTAVDGDDSPFMAPTSARILFEQGGQFSWMVKEPEIDSVQSIYEATMDDAANRKKRIVSALRKQCVAPEAIESLMYPLGRAEYAVDKRRTPANLKLPAIANVATQLGRMRLGHFEPDWGPLTYQLLTQVAHATPLGLLHAFSNADPDTAHARLSPEMTALAIDTACIGAAFTFRSLAPVVTKICGLPDPQEWLEEVFNEMHNIHYLSQPIHFLG